MYIYNIYFYFIIFPNTCRFLRLTMAFTSKCHSQATPSSEQRYPGPENVFSTLC